MSSFFGTDCNFQDVAVLSIYEWLGSAPGGTQRVPAFSPQLNENKSALDLGTIFECTTRAKVSFSVDLTHVQKFSKWV